MLPAVVGLLSEASAVHACFVYLLEPEGDRLVLRAASEPYADLVATISLERGEGLAWWSVEQREPAFIRDDALSDPRFKYVPELAEERFQSLVSVPIVGRGGVPIGVISLHTEAPREFTEQEVEFLVSSSSLVASAIENARLHSDTRRRLRQLELLNQLGERIAAAETRESLYDVVVLGVSELVQPGACHLYVLDSAAGLDQLTRVATQPSTADRDEERVPSRVGLAELGPELGRFGGPRDGVVRVPMTVGGELRGMLVLEQPVSDRPAAQDADIIETAASQGALALVKLELIERLREENAIGEFFDSIADGASDEVVAVQARMLGLDLAAPHVVLRASVEDARSGDWAGQLERALLRRFSGAVLDVRDETARALLPARAESGGASEREHRRDLLLDAHRAVQAALHVGLSSPCVGAEALRSGFEEAAVALRGARVLEGAAPVVSHEELGPYKYLLRVAMQNPGRDRHREALAALAAYDRRRSAQLVRTLEEYLRQRGNVSATAEALFVHQNTLRQRLERIEALTGMELRGEDWLTLDLALRLAALEQGAERVHDLERLAGD